MDFSEVMKEKGLTEEDFVGEDVLAELGEAETEETISN